MSGRVTSLSAGADCYTTRDRRAQAPVVSGGISDTARGALGYDPNTRQFSALNSVPHEVQGDQVLVPGGNIDTLRYIASRVGAAAGGKRRMRRCTTSTLRRRRSLAGASATFPPKPGVSSSAT